MAAISTAMFTLLKSGDEIVCSAAIYGGTFHIIEDLLSKLGITHRFVSLEELANPASVIGPRTQDRVVRVADQPDAALRGRARGGGGMQEGRRAVGHRQHLRQHAQPAGARRWAWTCRCKAARSTSTATAMSPAACCRARSALLAPMGKMRRLLGGVMDPLPAFALGAGHEDHAAARGAAQRECAEGGAVSRRPSEDRARLLPGPRLASRPRHRQASDERLRRRGDHRREGRQGRRLPDLRQAEGDQARGQPWRRREHLQPADSHVAVRADGRGAGEGGRLEGNDPDVDRARGRSRI